MKSGKLHPMIYAIDLIKDLVGEVHTGRYASVRTEEAQTKRLRDADERTVAALKNIQTKDREIAALKQSLADSATTLHQARLGDADAIRLGNEAAKVEIRRLQERCGELQSTIDNLRKRTPMDLTSFLAIVGAARMRGPKTLQGLAVQYLGVTVPQAKVKKARKP